MNPSDPIHLAAHEAATTLHRYLCETDRGLTCNEARAYANLLNELGIDTATFRSAHVRHDEDEDDDHHFGWVEPGDVEPGYNADLIEERRAAADA